MRLFPDSHKQTVRIAAVLVALTAVPLMGASNVGFTLGVQSAAPGSPYATYVAGWKAATYTTFPKPAGRQNDGQTYAPGDKISWDAEVAVSGTQQNGAGAGSPVYGAANIVFDLELRLNGTLVAGASVFQSDVNNGTGSDPLWSAAFPVAFNILGQGPGRAIDKLLVASPTKGGPFMNVTPPNGATNPGDGTLLGMGCGYSQWIKSQTALRTTQGVGMTTLPNGTTGTGVPGVGPVAEGQIDTTGFAAGTYTLSLIPGAGINVLRGDINLNSDQNAFAVAADATTPDSITFVIQTCSPIPGQASNPSPANAATGVSTSAQLGWTAASNAVSYDVNFGTTNPPPFVGNTAATAFDPGALAGSTQYFWRVDAISSGGCVTEGTVWSFTTAAPGCGAFAVGEVVDRHIFYNNSFYDTPGLGCNNFINGGQPCDDNSAIATDKTALLPGQTATFANYISYDKSINGIMIDVCGLPGTPTAADFYMAYYKKALDPGADPNDLCTWNNIVVVAPTITTAPGGGAFGSDRIKIILPDNTIPNTSWLGIWMFNTAQTGVEDIFAFGIAKGEGGPATSNNVGWFQVGAGDEVNCRAAQGFNPLTNPAPITEIYNYNRDGLIQQASDCLIARSNPTAPLTTALKAITFTVSCN